MFVTKVHPGLASSWSPRNCAGWKIRAKWRWNFRIAEERGSVQDTLVFSFLTRLTLGTAGLRGFSSPPPPFPTFYEDDILFCFRMRHVRRIKEQKKKRKCEVKWELTDPFDESNNTSKFNQHLPASASTKIGKLPVTSAIASTSREYHLLFSGLFFAWNGCR